MYFSLRCVTHHVFAEIMFTVLKEPTSYFNFKIKIFNVKTVKQSMQTKDIVRSLLLNYSLSKKNIEVIRETNMYP